MRRTVSPILAACLLAVSLAAGGCSKPAKAPTAAAAPEPLTADASAVDLYNAHRYQEARAKAEADLPRTKGREHEVNQLTAGLAAYAQSQPALAEHYLEPLTGSSDPAIAGRAEATLGQIAEKKGNHQYAADLFKRASAHLEGDDATRAAVRAGTSLSEVGQPAARSAAAMKVAAPKQPNSLAISQPTTKGGQTRPYTIQVGAFASRAAADSRAKEITTTAAKAGLGQPRVVPDTINGKPGYSVQIGAFAVRQAALAAKSRLGTGTYIVVAMN